MLDALDTTDGMVSESIRSQIHDSGEAVGATPKEKLTKSNTRPGSIEWETTLLINTEQAVLLINGRERQVRGEQVIPSIVSLFQYAKQMVQVELAYKAGDPYADYHLVVLQQKITKAKETLKTIKQSLQIRVEEESMLKVGAAKSKAPIPFNFIFKSVFAFKVADLIGHMDKITLLCLASSHTGVITRKESKKTIATVTTLIRGIFHYPTQYKFSNVNREDIKNKTRAALLAEEKYGRLPEEIINRTIVPSWLE